MPLLVCDAMLNGLSVTRVMTPFASRWILLQNSWRPWKQNSSVWLSFGLAIAPVSSMFQ